MTHTPRASIIVPAYNVAATVRETLAALSRQTFVDFELIVIDDGATDETPALLKAHDDPRLRVIRQRNRGLAGARNSGIHHARGEFIAFCDADDVWEPEKLERHIAHLTANPDVGLSYAGSSMINEEGVFLKVAQRPKLKGITPADIFRRNPIGNGSSAVFRREALMALRHRPPQETERDWWFDETLRQSEDIDAWMRFALTTDWKIEGIPGLLTRYRIQRGGLSANLGKQFETWCRMRDKVRDLSPAFAAKHGPSAEAYQLRYLARRAFMMGDGKTARLLARRALATSRSPLRQEPVKTLITLAAAELLGLRGPHFDMARMLSPRPVQ
ncbi:MAG: glycosyltransferase family A protein [Hyphomicrobiales bacterium]